MTDALPMLAGMPVLRGITASHRATAETGAEMDPPIPELDALLANGAIGLHRDQPDEVLTRLVSVRNSPPSPKIALPEPFWRGDLDP
jgi:hypothetical protein